MVMVKNLRMPSLNFKKNVPADMKLEPGMSLTLSNQAGQAGSGIDCG